MARPTPTFYVFHGSDELTRSETVAEFRQRLGSAETADLNTTWLDGRTVSQGELAHACQSIPFLADRRLVVVSGLLTRYGRESAAMNSLLDLLLKLPETTRLILVEDAALSDDHPVLRLVREKAVGYVRRFDPPEARELPQWIIRRAQKHGGQIEPEAAAQLAQAIGSELRLLDQEIGKLVTYAGPERVVTAADVARLVPYAQQAVIFDLVDALGQRDGRTATTTLQRLLNDGQEPMGILGMIIRQFRLLIQTKELAEGGENAASVAQVLGLHPFPAGKLHRQAANFTTAQLEKVYRRLLETDLQIKSGELTPEAALELLVAGLAG